MPTRERFLVLLCSYLGLLLPEGQAWQYESILSKARALDIKIFDDPDFGLDPEKSAWEYARWSAGYGYRPEWVPRG
jgi:hypothetical protein